MRPLALVALAALLAGCASNSYPRDRVKQALDRGINKASPGLIVARELAFARAAREDGQWTAFRAFAADDAVMFVPEPIKARTWLGKQEDPAEPVQWQPHEVWMSCDGTLAATKGAWQRTNGTFGYFTTLWERQGDGEYKWVLDQGDVLEEPLTEPDFIRSTIADCGSEESIAVGEGEYFDLPASGARSSRDSTLVYSWKVERDLSRRITVTALLDGEASDVVAVEIPAPVR